jgi:hypothetical protein
VAADGVELVEDWPGRVWRAVGLGHISGDSQA